MTNEEKLTLLGYKKPVSFTVYGTAILGDMYANSKVTIKSMDMESASDTGLINPPELHLSVFPTIPPENNVPTDPEELTYIKVKLSNGDNAVLALEWIVGSSIKGVGTLTATSTCEGVTVEDLQRINEMWANNGYPNVKTVIW